MSKLDVFRMEVEKLRDKTIGRKADVGNKNAHSKISNHARRTYLKTDKPKKCVICGYDRHFDVAHKRDVADFPPDALISEINDIGNLVALCKNHHWEFDNREMSEEDIRSLLLA